MHKYNNLYSTIKEKKKMKEYFSKVNTMIPIPCSQGLSERKKTPWGIILVITLIETKCINLVSYMSIQDFHPDLHKRNEESFLTKEIF